MGTTASIQQPAAIPAEKIKKVKKIFYELRVGDNDVDNREIKEAKKWAMAEEILEKNPKLMVRKSLIRRIIIIIYITKQIGSSLCYALDF